MGHHTYAFQCRHHGNGGGNNAVPVKQGSADQPQHHNNLATWPLNAACSQLHQGQRTALAFVIQTQHHRHILDGNHQGQQPEQQGQHSIDLFGTGLSVGTQGHFHGVERAGSNIAVHHA